MITFWSTFILGIVLALPLGPVTLEILRRGLKFGFFESFKTVLGAGTAEMLFFTITYFGIARFAESPMIKIGLGSFGVLFLLYMGYSNIMSFVNGNGIEGKKGFYKKAYFSGFAIAFFNPMNFFLWAGIIAGFLAQNGSFSSISGILLGIFLSLMIVCVIGSLGKKIVKKDKMKYVSLIAGLFLVYYALRLLSGIFVLNMLVYLLVISILVEIIIIKIMWKKKDNFKN